MRGVLIVMFWAWLAVSVAVYGYRIWRRISRTSDATRTSLEAAADGRSAALGTDPDSAGEPSGSDLPRSLAERLEGLPVDATPSVDEPAPIAPSPLGPTRAPTVADALRGIILPCDLAPIADVVDAVSAAGRRVVFTTRTSDLRTVSASLADELESIGYQTSDAATDASGAHRRIIAVRADTTLSIAVTLDDTGAVAAEVNT